MTKLFAEAIGDMVHCFYDMDCAIDEEDYDKKVILENFLDNLAGLLSAHALDREDVIKYFIGLGLEEL